MAARRRVDNLMNKDAAAFLVYLCALCVVSMLVSLTQGTGPMFYAGFPVWLSAAYLVMSIAGNTAEVRTQIQTRVKKRHFNDARQMYRAAMIGALTTGTVMLVFYTLLAQVLASGLFGIRDSYLVLYTMAPTVFLGSFIGNMRGVMEATGSRHLSRLSMLILSGLTVILSIIASMRMAVRGEKVGALLMNTGYKAVYVAAGVGTGISIAVTVTFIMLLILSHFSVRFIKDHEDHLAIDNEEHISELVPYYYVRTSPYGLAAMLPVLLLIINYRLYTRTIDGATAADYHSEWGGFMGIAVPFVMLLVCGLSSLYTKEIDRMTSEFVKESYKKLRLRFSMVMRLTGYLLIPATFYTFGAAKPFVEIFHGGLYGSATDGAVISLKYMSPMIFLGTTMLLMMMFYWSSRYRSLVIVSCLFGAAFEIGAMSILSGLHLGMYAVPIALDIYAAAYLGCAYFLGKRQILARCDSSWIVDDLFVTFAAVIPAFLVVLLNDFMTESIYPVIGVILLLALYVPIYVVLAIYLNCTDYGNITRFPGGRIIVHVAMLLGRVSEE